MHRKHPTVARKSRRREVLTDTLLVDINSHVKYVVVDEKIENRCLVFVTRQ